MRRSRLLVLAPLAVLAFACARGPEAPARPVVTAAELSAGIEKALALRGEGKREEAMALLEQLRLEALEVKQAQLATLALNRRGDVANDLGRKGEARQDYETAYAEAAGRSDFAAMGRAAHDRALLNSDVWGAGEPDALLWYPRAVEARKKAGDLVGVRRSANNLAIQYFYAQRKEEALRWYGEALAAGEAAQDWDGLYRVHANLALLHAVEAEGAFEPGASLRAWVPPAKLEPGAEAKAREHFARAIEVAAKIGREEGDACGVFGNYGARCARLSPGADPVDGLVAFFAELALEAADEPSDAAAQLQAGLLCLRASDAATAAGARLARQKAELEAAARRHLEGALALGGGAEALCKSEPRAFELCARLNAPPKAKGKPGTRGK